MARRRQRQETLPFKRQAHEGKKLGRPKKDGAGMSHLKRLQHDPKYPVHVTLKLVEGLPSLRKIRALEVLASAFYGGKKRFGFRLNHYSVQSNHLHLIVEATDRDAMTRGMKGLNVRIAKALNKMWKRKGRVIADRYHEVVLKSPRQVKNALAYVFNNAWKHGLTPLRRTLIDTFTSGAWFDGWRGTYESRIDPDRYPPPVARARTWLLSKGWRRCGLVSPIAS